MKTFQRTSELLKRFGSAAGRGRGRVAVFKKDLRLTAALMTAYAMLDIFGAFMGRKLTQMNELSRCRIINVRFNLTSILTN